MNRNLLKVFLITLMSVLMGISAFAQKPDVQVSTNADLEYALSNPAYRVIEITESGYYAAINRDAETGLFLFKGESTSKDNNNCCIYSIQTGNSCMDTNDDGEVISTEFLLISSVEENAGATVTGTCPGDNEGWWSVLDSTSYAYITFKDPNGILTDQNEIRTLDTVIVVVDAAGVYRFQNTWYATPQDPMTQVLGSANGSFYYFNPPMLEINAEETYCETANLSIDLDQIQIIDNVGNLVPARDLEWEWSINGEYIDPIIDSLPNDIANLGDIEVVFDPSEYDQFNNCGEYTLAINVTSIGVQQQELCDNSAEATFYIYDKPVITNFSTQFEDNCGLTATLNRSFSLDCDNTITPTETFTVLEGPGSAAFTNNEIGTETNMEVTECGQYIVEYKVQNGDCFSTATTTVNFFDTPELVNMSDDLICGVQTENGYLGEANLHILANMDCTNGVTPTIVWTAITEGINISDVNGFSTTATVTECGTYTVQAVVSNGTCTATKDVTIKFYDKPTIDATDVPAEVCGTTLSTTIVPAAQCEACNDEPIAPKDLETGEVIWTNQTQLEANTNNITLTFTLNAVTNQGENINEVNLEFPSNMQIVSVEPITLGGGSLQPTVSGNEINFTGSIEANTAVDFNVVCNTISAGTNPLVYIVRADNPGQQDGTFSTMGDIYFRVVSQEECLDGELVALNDDVIITEGNDNMWGIEVPECGIYEFEYNAVNGPCESTKTMTIAFFDKPELSINSNPKVCGLETTLDGMINIDCENNQTPVITWTSTNGLTGIIYSPTNNVEDVMVTVPSCGEYTFEMNVKNGPCENTVSTTVYFYDTPDVLIDATEGNDICGLETIVEGNYSLNCNNDMTPTTTWTSVPTGAVFSNTATGETMITVPNCGEYTFYYNVNNDGICEATASETIYFYDTPEITIDTETDVCGLESSLSMNYTLSCDNNITPTIVWTSNESGVVFDNDDEATTNFTVPTCGEYEFTVTVNNGVCTASENVTVRFYDTPAIDVDNVPAAICGYVTDIYPTFTTNCSVDDNGSFNGKMFGNKEIHGDITLNTTTIENNQDNVTLSFHLDAESDDWEFISGVTLNFPEGFTITDASNIIDQQNTELIFAIVDGNKIQWFGNSNNSSSSTLGDEAIADFEVICNVGDVSGELTIDYLIQGDTWGNEPHTIEGGLFISVNNPDPTPDPIIDQLPAFDALTAITAGATVTETASDGFNIVVDECGTYEFLYTVVNGPCTATETIEITFFEQPELEISGLTDVTTCSEQSYSVENVSCEVAGQLVSYTWTIEQENASPVTTMGAITEINFDQYPGTVTVTVEAIININDGSVDFCEATPATYMITKRMPQIDGQVKYWNEFETYMPSPYQTFDYATYPHDYFYVTLLKDGQEIDAQYSNKKVMPRLMEDLNELMSFFTFDINTEEWGCESDLQLKIWDGGLVYHNISNPVPVVSGTHLGANYTYKNWGGVNATDALAIQLMVGGANEINGAPYNYNWVGLSNDAPQYGYYSHSIADVNNTNPVTTGGITALDALTAKYRAVGLIANYPDNGSNNEFAPNFRVTGRMVNELPYITFPKPFDFDNVEDVSFTHSGAEYEYFTPATDHAYTSADLPWKTSDNFINVYYEAIGDVNASFVPEGNLMKNADNGLAYNGVIKAQEGDVITIPVRVQNDVKANAISLMMNYRNDLVEVLSTNFSDDDSYINHENGIVNISWFNTTDAKTLNEGDVIAEVTVKVLADITESVELFTLSQNFEVADATATVIKGVTVETVKLSNTVEEVVAQELTASNYPNPFKGNTTIKYVLPENGDVNVAIYNNQGVLVSTLVNATQNAGTQYVEFNENVPAGMYFYHITVKSENNTYSVVNKMIVK